MKAKKLKGKVALGAKLVELRDDKGYAQNEAAFMAGIPPATMNRYENGKRLPTRVHLDILCNQYGVPKNIELLKHWYAEKIIQSLSKEVGFTIDDQEDIVMDAARYAIDNLYL